MRQGTTVIASALLLGLALAPWPARGDSAPLPDSRLGVRTAPLLLLSRPDVQADLKMSRTQVDDAEAALRDLYVKAAGLRGVKGEKAVAARRAIDEQQRQWIETRLSEPQRKRLVQIDLQWEGPSALVSRPAVAVMLDLTPDQLATLKKAVDQSARSRSRGEPTSKAEGELSRQTLATLSDAQKLRWKAMLGHPFQPQLAQSESSTATK
jgi:hypothetical protein